MTNEPKSKNALVELAKSIEASRPVPTIEALCLDTPLYDPVPVSNTEFLDKFRVRNWQFDAYCVSCAKDSTFKTRRSYGTGSGTAHDPQWMLKPGYIDLEFSCQRQDHHKYLFCFRYDGKNLVKYGQNPSLEDIAGADIRKYEKVLPKGYFGELKRAGGLASHGIGIGAFVYLRRIFERLIFEHHEELDTPVEGFPSLRMDEKIAALKEVLPPALVENKAAYGILSTGIHELDEESCRRHFPVVRAAIIAILEQDLQQKQRDEQAKQLREEIAKVAGGLKGERQA